MTTRYFGAWLALSGLLLVSACGAGENTGRSDEITLQPDAPKPDDGTTDPATYTVTATAGPGGGLSPAVLTVEEGEAASFTVTTDVFYEIDSVTGCHGNLAGDAYTTGPITADCTVQASFRLSAYAIGGTMEGLVEGKNLTLRLNGASDLTLDHTDNGVAFTFPATLAHGADYEVTLVEQPPNHECVIESGAGTVNGAPVDDIMVVCDSFPVVSPGLLHTLMLKADGTLWATGDNSQGQLGLGDFDGRETFTPIGERSDWVRIAAGDSFSMALNAAGELWGWGNNSLGQLGLGHTDNVTPPEPVRIGADSDWIDIGVGIQYAAARKRDGTVWTWGLNANAQLGLGDTAARYAPTRVTTATWVSLTVGPQSVQVLNAEGELWGWGSSLFNILGPYSTNITLPTRYGDANGWLVADIANSHAAAVKTDGSLWAWGVNHKGQCAVSGGLLSIDTATRVGDATDWARVSTGTDFTLALKADGSLFGFGNNADGRLGLGDTSETATPSPITSAAGAWRGAEAGLRNTLEGGNFAFGVARNGTVWAWGDNTSGQLGLGAVAGVTVPTEVVLE